MVRGRFLLTLGAMTTLLCSCASLLYYPSRKQQTNLKKMGPSSPENIQFQSRDGTPLHGWYFRNQTHTRPKALLVFFHGNAENLSTHFAHLYWILKEGYDFFIFDYQGYGRSGGKPSPKSTVNDGIAALCWATQRKPDVPLVVFGQSLGGAVALRSVIETRQVVPINSVIVDSTFHSYRKVAQLALSQHWLTWLLQPLPYLVLSDRFAPGKRIAEIAPIPLLIFHGEKDQTVSHQLGRKVYELAREPKEFVSIPEGHHIETFWVDGGEYRQLLLDRLGHYRRRSMKSAVTREETARFCEATRD